MVDFLYNKPDLGQARTVVIAHFRLPEEAVECKEMINSRFGEIQSKIDALFNKHNGEAQFSDLLKIYAEYGFTNNVGWEHDIPVVAKDRDIAWALAPGTDLDEAESLIRTMNPLDIESYQQNAQFEDWQLFHLPPLMPIPDEDELAPMESSSEGNRTSTKRLLH